eukprot:6204475-Pleurochrysis_carterae.AAC.4
MYDLFNVPCKAIVYVLQSAEEPMVARDTGQAAFACLEPVSGRAAASLERLAISGIKPQLKLPSINVCCDEQRLCDAVAEEATYLATKSPREHSKCLTDAADRLTTGYRGTTALKYGCFLIASHFQ